MAEFAHKQTIIKLITAFHPEAKIYLFGSYARGTNRAGSDIDIAVDIGRRLTLKELSFLSNLFEAISMAQTVDLVDIQAIPEKMQQAIMTTGVVWKR